MSLTYRCDRFTARMTFALMRSVFFLNAGLMYGLGAMTAVPSSRAVA